MQEQDRPKRGLQPYMLSQAVKNYGGLIHVRCQGCSKARWYDPQDILKLLGDIPTMNLGREMKCGRCGCETSADLKTPPAAERQHIVVRRLDKIWWVRRVSWRTEKL